MVEDLFAPGYKGIPYIEVVENPWFDNVHGSFKTGLNTADAHSVKTLTKKNREVNRIPETDTGF